MAESKTNRFMWSKHPEEAAWLARYCKGRTLRESADAFEEEFGIKLTEGQVRGFRERQGIRKYRKKRVKAVGEEMSRGGYVYVQVASDLGNFRNWRPKGVLEWERANGRPLPDGQKVMFLDGDIFNFDPDNLVAVDKKKAAVLARLMGEGVRWSSREELETLLAIGQEQAEGMPSLRRDVCPRQEARPAGNMPRLPGLRQKGLLLGEAEDLRARCLRQVRCRVRQALRETESVRRMLRQEQGPGVLRSLEEKEGPVNGLEERLLLPSRVPRNGQTTEGVRPPGAEEGRDLPQVRALRRGVRPQREDSEVLRRMSKEEE